MGYVIFYTKDSSHCDRDWVVEGVVVDKMTITIKSLAPDTAYFIKNLRSRTAITRTTAPSPTLFNFVLIQVNFLPFSSTLLAELWRKFLSGCSCYCNVHLVHSIRSCHVAYRTSIGVVETMNYCTASGLVWMTFVFIVILSFNCDILPNNNNHIITSAVHWLLFAINCIDFYFL